MANYSSMSDVSRIVDTLVTDIETNFREFNISEIIEALRQGDDMFECWVKKLDSFLTGYYGAQRYNRTNMTRRSVQFVFKDIAAKVEVEVDLLVSPYFSSPHEFYTCLKKVHRDKRDGFTVCASKWQVRFFQRQPPQVNSALTAYFTLAREMELVKEYIRKAKQWRNDKWSGGGEGRPSSYLLSLLVVAAYEQNPHNVAQGLKDLIRRADTLDLTWPGECYELRDVPSFLPSRPRIVDPANPANNVWKTGLQSCKGHTPSNYEPGNGYTGSIRENILSISKYI